jgi:hypothetical protein
MWEYKFLSLRNQFQHIVKLRAFSYTAVFNNLTTVTTVS